MSMDRVQLQRELSIAAFMSRYGAEEKCEAAPIAARWPAGLTCPACGGGGSRTSFSRED
jgi:hypothetical protein